MSPTRNDSQLLELCARLAPQLREQRERIEESGRPVPEQLAELADAGLFRMLVPRELGGLDVHPRTFAAALHALAQGDAATAWCVMTGSTTAVMSGYLPDDGAQELFADEPQAIYAGVFAPFGRLHAEAGGYRLSGRWPFASGCEGSTWISLGARVEGEEGEKVVSVFLPTSEVKVHQTWAVSGLRGTGSHDVSVDGALIPEHRICEVTGRAPLRGGPVMYVPVFGLLAGGVSAVALGIARSALDEFADMMRNKRQANGRVRAHSELVQILVAELEGEYQAGQAVLWSALDEAYGHGGGEIPLSIRARLRSAACQATRAAVRVVDGTYRHGGGAALYNRCVLSQHFRDVHAITQHLMVAPATERTIGRALLEIEGDYSQL